MRLFNTLSIFMFLMITLPMSFCFAELSDKYYGPVQEELIGTVKKMTFPGPPNYEDVSKGDISETCPYLILDNPVNVSSNETGSDSFYADEKDVQLIQLAVNKKNHWKLMSDGERVKVKGELFEAHTGHHHTRVLMFVHHVEKENTLPSISLKKVRIQCGADNGFCEVHYR